MVEARLSPPVLCSWARETIPPPSLSSLTCIVPASQHGTSYDFSFSEKSGWGKNLLSQQSIQYPLLLLTSTTPPRAPEEPPLALLQFFVYTAAASIMPFSHSHLPVSSTTLRKKSKPCPLSYKEALHEPPCPLSSATLPLNYCVLATLAFFQSKNTKFSPDSGHSHRLFLLLRKLFSVRLQLTHSHASYPSAGMLLPQSAASFPGSPVC